MIDVSKKTVLLRVDFNVPLNNGVITDDTRMRAALPTINYLRDQEARVVIISHLGRPQKQKLDNGDINVEKFSLRHLVDHLSDLLRTEVHFSAEHSGDSVKEKIATLGYGEVILLENTRFHPGETKGDEAFAQALSELADVYINDAFGTAHRNHSSTAAVARFFNTDQKDVGFLMQEEIKHGEKVLHAAASPFVAILGGAKVSDKIGLIEALLPKTDVIIIGGAMAFTFIKAQGGQVGTSLVEDDKLELARTLIAQAKASNTQLLLPTDARTNTSFSNDGESIIYPIGEIPEGKMGLDIGPGSEKIFASALSTARTILWNGPMGVFEFSNYAHGTQAVALAVAGATDLGCFSLVGGGDSVAAVNQLDLSKRISFVSTGGGAMLEYLEGKTLPGLKALGND